MLFRKLLTIGAVAIISLLCIFSICHAAPLVDGYTNSSVVEDLDVYDVNSGSLGYVYQFSNSLATGASMPFLIYVPSTTPGIHEVTMDIEFGGTNIQRLFISRDPVFHSSGSTINMYNYNTKYSTAMFHVVFSSAASIASTGTYLVDYVYSTSARMNDSIKNYKLYFSSNVNTRTKYVVGIQAIGNPAQAQIYIKFRERP